MTDKDDKIQRQNKKKVENDGLWEHVTRDVTPLKNKDRKPNSIKNEAPKKSPVSKSTEPTKPPVPKKNIQKPETDRRTAERLRKGQIPIQARLDLHGMGREAAYTALQKFIVGCHNKEFRCVLIITGKGARGPLEPETGVLKQHTPQWLSSPPLEQYVLKIQTARQKDGGSGALYVLLRKKRN
jgi:DNA-nicking Smr family endonuclease